MKNTMKKAFVVFLVIVLVLSTIIVVEGDTVYEYYGIKYNIINNSSVAICGRSDDVSFVVVPEKINNREVTEISDRAFSLDSELTGINLEFATHLKRIGSFAFRNCSGMSGTLTLTSSIEEIGTAAFENCTSLEVAIIDAPINEIPAQCFNGCSSLRRASLNSTITSVGNYAFADCAGLRYIEIPAGVSWIANSAFRNDTNLTLGVYYETYAHQYAEEKGIDFVILDPENVPTEPPTEPPTQEPITEAPETEPPTQAQDTQAPETQASETLPPVVLGYYLGDVDCNNNVESIDMTFVQRYLADLQYPAVCDFSHADIDGDDDVTIIDVTLIDRFLAMFDVPYPVGTWIEA